MTIAIKIVSASLAQWLEHWSRKPGVESSNLSRGYSYFSFKASVWLRFSYPTLAVKLFLQSWLVANLFFPLLFSVCSNLQLRTFNIMLCKKLCSLYSLDRRNSSFTSQMKATEQYFPVVLFIMLYKVVLPFESVSESYSRKLRHGSSF